MEFITAITPALRYAMLGVVLFVVIRMLVALFCKKTTDPIRAKLVNSITGEGLPLYDREVSLGVSGEVVSMVSAEASLKVSFFNDTATTEIYTVSSWT